MERDDEWAPSYQQQHRPVSLPAGYEIPDDMEHTKPSSSTNAYSRGRGRPQPLHPPSPSMPIPIPSNPHVIPGNNLPSAPASPPTPAPSPSPRLRVHAPDWSTAGSHEDLGLSEDDQTEIVGSSSTFQGRSRGKSAAGLGYRHMRSYFAEANNEERKRLLAELLNMCDGKLLGFVAGFVAPRLKRDPFSVLPNELCLRVSIFLVFDCEEWQANVVLDLDIHRRRKDIGQIITSLTTVARTG